MTCKRHELAWRVKNIMNHHDMSKAWTTMIREKHEPPWHVENMTTLKTTTWHEKPWPKARRNFHLNFGPSSQSCLPQQAASSKTWLPDRWKGSTITSLKFFKGVSMDMLIRTSGKFRVQCLQLQLPQAGSLARLDPPSGTYSMCPFLPRWEPGHQHPPTPWIQPSRFSVPQVVQVLQVVLHWAGPQPSQLPCTHLCASSY